MKGTSVRSLLLRVAGIAVFLGLLGPISHFLRGFLWADFVPWVWMLLAPAAALNPVLNAGASTTGGALVAAADHLGSASVVSQNSSIQSAATEVLGNGGETRRSAHSVNQA